MPCCLLPGTGDGDGVDIGAAIEYDCCSESSPEGGEFFRGEKCIGGAC